MTARTPGAASAAESIDAVDEGMGAGGADHHRPALLGHGPVGGIDRLSRHLGGSVETRRERPATLIASPAPGRRHCEDGVDDRPVTGAPTDVAFEVVSHIGAGGLRICVRSARDIMMKPGVQ